MKQTGLIERVVEALGLDDGYTRGLGCIFLFTGIYFLDPKNRS